MNHLALSIGSNSKDKERQMADCIEWLRNRFNGTAFSKVYNSKALNGHDPDYLNAVAQAETPHGYEEVNDMLKKYEAACGRSPASKQTGKVPIDIDIVVWNGEVVREKDFAQNYFQIGWQQLSK